MSVRRGDVVLMDYPYTACGAKTRPALVRSSRGGEWEYL
jgi:mRNA-degrading endonuclease toxin of MazEF toxin-antitoxin module